MQIFRHLLLLIFCVTLISCGGGGGGSSSDGTTVKFKLNFESSQRIKSLFEQNGRLKISNTDIGYVSLGYHKVGGDSYTLDVTDAAENNTEISVTGLEVGSNYIFSVYAFADGTQQDLVCTGSSGAVQIANGVDVNLTCSISDVEDISRLVTGVADLMENVLNNPDNFTAAYEALGSLVSTDFTYDDGMSREEFMNDILNPSYDFIDIAHIVSITITQSLDRSGAKSSKTLGESDMSSADIVFTYDNGAKVREHVSFVFEDGKWKLTGNGRKFMYDLELESVMLTSPSVSVADFYSGVRINFYDVISDRVVSSTEISSDFTEDSVLNAGSPYLPLSDKYLLSGIGTLDNYFIPIETLSSGDGVMPVGTVFTADVDYTADAGGGNETITIETYADGVSAADVDSSYFTHVYTSVENPATTSDVDLVLSKPAAYDIAYYDVEVSWVYYGDMTLSGSDSFMLGPNTESVNLEELITFVFGADEGFIKISAVDMQDRKFTTYLKISGGKLIVGTSSTRPTILTTEGFGVFGIQKTILMPEIFSPRHGLLLNDGKSVVYGGTYSDNYYGGGDNHVAAFTSLKYDSSTNSYAAAAYKLLGTYEYSSGEYANATDVVKMLKDASGNIYVLMDGYDSVNYKHVPFVFKLAPSGSGYTVAWSKAIHESDFGEQTAIDITLNSYGNSLIVLTDRDSTSGYITILCTTDASIENYYAIYDTSLSGKDFYPFAVVALYNSSNFAVAGDVVNGSDTYSATYYMSNSTGYISKRILQYGSDTYTSSVDIVMAEDGKIYTLASSTDYLLIFPLTPSGSTLSYSTPAVYSTDGMNTSLTYDSTNRQLLLVTPIDGIVHFSRFNRRLELIGSNFGSDILVSEYANAFHGPHMSAVSISDSSSYGSEYGVTVNVLDIFSNSRAIDATSTFAARKQTAATITSITETDVVPVVHTAPNINENSIGSPLVNITGVSIQ